MVKRVKKFWSSFWFEKKFDNGDYVNRIDMATVFVLIGFSIIGVLIYLLINLV